MWKLLTQFVFQTSLVLLFFDNDLKGQSKDIFATFSAPFDPLHLVKFYFVILIIFKECEMNSKESVLYSLILVSNNSQHSQEPQSPLECCI
jgi:hypothetical protein